MYIFRKSNGPRHMYGVIYFRAFTFIIVLILRRTNCARKRTDERRSIIAVRTPASTLNCARNGWAGSAVDCRILGWTTTPRRRRRRRRRLARDKGRRRNGRFSPTNNHRRAAVQLTGLGAFGFLFYRTQVP